MIINALTYRHNGIARDIITPVKLKNLFSDQIIETKGLWDTGATDSVITKNTAKTLGLIPISKAIVNGVHGSKEVNVYYINITLNNNQITLDTQVTDCEELSSDYSVGMLIGMNIITRGDFSITNFDNNTIMSFRVPSIEGIDYVNEINEYNKYLQIHNCLSKIGNEKCPCNSGKKWKNCHGASKYSF